MSAQNQNQQQYAITSLDAALSQGQAAGQAALAAQQAAAGIYQPAGFQPGTAIPQQGPQFQPPGQQYQPQGPQFQPPGQQQQQYQPPGQQQQYQPPGQQQYPQYPGQQQPQQYQQYQPPGQQFQQPGQQQQQQFQQYQPPGQQGGIPFQPAAPQYQQLQPVAPVGYAPPALPVPASPLSKSAHDVLRSVNAVDGYIQEQGTTFSTSGKGRYTHFVLGIDLDTCVPIRVITYGGKSGIPIKYYKTKDGITCLTGELWQNVVALCTAQGSRAYETLEVPCVLLEPANDTTPDTPMLYPLQAGTVLGYTPSVMKLRELKSALVAQTPGQTQFKVKATPAIFTRGSNRWNGTQWTYLGVWDTGASAF